MDLADDFTASTEKPPTREEALAAAAELERFIGRLIAGRAKPGDMPSKPPVVLISYARATSDSAELRGQVENKTNALQLAASTLMLTTAMGREQDARNARLRAALEKIATPRPALACDLREAAQAALEADTAQQERDDSIAADTSTGDLFGDALAPAAAAPEPDPKDCALEYYQAAFEHRRPTWVPSRVSVPHQVRGDPPFGHTMVVDPGEHACECNQWGAVSVRARNGQMLGIKSREFSVLAWQRNTAGDGSHG